MITTTRKRAKTVKLLDPLAGSRSQMSVRAPGLAEHRNGE
jgi:hypothetical protein